jgi:hypothetical protein
MWALLSFGEGVVLEQASWDKTCEFVFTKIQVLLVQKVTQVSWNISGKFVTPNI